jgi:hypothetical protein
VVINTDCMVVDIFVSGALGGVGRAVIGEFNFSYWNCVENLKLRGIGIVI